MGLPRPGNVEVGRLRTLGRPYENVSVPGSRVDLVERRVDCAAVDGLEMAFELLDQLAVAYSEHAQVVFARNEQIVFGAVVSAAHLNASLSESFDLAKVDQRVEASRHVPQPDVTVVAKRDQLAAVLSEGEAQH